MTRNVPTAAFLALATLLAPVPYGRADAPADVGENVVVLEAGDRSFGAIHRPARGGEARGAVVLLHDQGTGPDSHEVIRPLRLALSAAGWDTLSLELPAAGRGEDRRDWLDRGAVISARLGAGIDWLAGRGLRRPAGVALGDSATPLLASASEGPGTALGALVLISASAGADDADALAALGRLRLPVLDVVAERDAPAVLQTAEARRLAAADNAGYRQMTVPGAVAGFAGLEASLSSRVRAWLAVYAAAPAQTGR